MMTVKQSIEAFKFNTALANLKFKTTFGAWVIGDHGTLVQTLYLGEIFGSPKSCSPVLI